MNRLTIRNSDGSVSQPTHSTFEKVFNRLAEYEDMEEQGLLVRLPCKLGIDAYFVNEATEEVCEAVVTNIELNYYTPSRVWLEVSYVSKLIGKQGYYHCANELIGKKLFFTREAAEKALEEVCRKNT